MQTITQKNQRKKQKGFTLIELLVVLFILGLLVAYVGPELFGKTDDARALKVKLDLRSLESTLDIYQLKNNTYPSTDEGLSVLGKEYIRRVPKDPWDRDYLYIFPGTHGKFDLFTYGADGVEGGEGSNKDIGNWEL